MINSVVKAIKILELFSAAEPRLSLAEISRRLKMPKSTAHNLLATLHAEGFIERVDGELYALGAGPLILTQHMRVNVELRDPAAPLLRQLADASRESVYLTVRDGDAALYIYAVESPHRLLARTAVGERAMLHCTSVGKAMLAWLPEQEAAAVIARTGLPAYTATTITDAGALRAELAVTRARGYSRDAGEHEAGTYCLGAPILDARGLAFAACSVSGPDPAILGARQPKLAEAVMGAAQGISRLMGYVAPSVAQARRRQPHNGKLF